MLREDPLASLGFDEYGNAIPKDDENDMYDPEGANNDNDTLAASITHNLGQADPLADFHKLEVMMINRHDFESWESKKLKVFAKFQSINEGKEIIIDERRDRDTDRVIRLGKGKSRMDQLEVKTSKTGSSSRNMQMISASEFTT